MTQEEKAQRFRALHKPGQPLVLFNIWDAGSAAAIAKAGALALATGSWSVAAAQGFADGEAMPLALALDVVGRIAAASDLPLSVDFEGGYAADAEALAQNVTRVIAAGAIGINFEDQVVGGTGLYPVDTQAARIIAVRQAAKTSGIALFVNARTDLFLQAEATDHAGLLDAALARQAAYAAAGADGFFAPGLTDPALIRALCAGSSLPVNVMVAGDPAPIAAMGGLGVARVSMGPGPFRTMLADLKARYLAVAGGT